MNTQRLKILRECRGISQKQVAKDLKLNYQRYNHYETGRSEPDNAILQQLADYFETSIDFLLGRDNEQTVQEQEIQNGLLKSLNIKDFNELSKEKQALLAKTINDMIKTLKQ